MSPGASWLLVAGVWIGAGAVVAAVCWLGSGLFDDDLGPDAPPARPVGYVRIDGKAFDVVSAQVSVSPVTFDELEFERAVLATIDQLPDVAT